MAKNDSYRQNLNARALLAWVDVSYQIVDSTPWKLFPKSKGGCNYLLEEFSRATFNVSQKEAVTDPK